MKPDPEHMERREPVAWRVKDFADDWILCHSERQALAEADSAGNLIEPLYRSPSPPDELSALRERVKDRQWLARAIYNALYEHQGGKWAANETKSVWLDTADRLSASLLQREGS